MIRDPLASKLVAHDDPVSPQRHRLARCGVRAVRLELRERHAERSTGEVDQHENGALAVVHGCQIENLDLLADFQR